MHPILMGSLVCQGIAILIAFLVPFGFDHPSSLGLTFAHFLLLLVFYASTLVAGVIVALATGRYMLATIQAGVACASVFLAYAMGI